MFSFSVDPRSGGFGSNESCNSCCCESLSARPGETNKVMINYAPWSAPIGGRGLANDTAFSIAPVSIPPVPAVVPGAGRTIANTPFNGDLAPLFPNPEQEEVTYRIEPLFGPSQGSIVLNPNGTFVYTPNPLFTGIDRFWWSANGNIAEFIIAVDVNAEQEFAFPGFTAAVSVSKKSVGIDHRLHIMGFFFSASPAAIPGDVYRLTIKQGASNCNGEIAVHLSCYDIVIGACG